MGETIIALQEELDWTAYGLYGLLDEPQVSPDPNTVPPVALGQRGFEIVLARRMGAGEVKTIWFERHHSTPIAELPDHWPEEYRHIVERRIELIENDQNIGLIERPECKRRWASTPWKDQLEAALRTWLLDRLESYFDLDGRMNEAGQPTACFSAELVSVARLADVAASDDGFLQAATLYRERDDFDVPKLVAELVEAESVPLLPVIRYKPTGLEKRRAWERTWDLQRLEDTIDARSKLPKDDPDYLNEFDALDVKSREVGEIPVPPKYSRSDFQHGEFWRMRGKLDVPKERWVSFPHCEGEDGTLVLAWAGLDHCQLARAIGNYYHVIEERVGGTDDPRLVPLLAGILELLPWITQWHGEIDPQFGVRMDDYFRGLVEEEARKMGLTSEELRAWQPPARARQRRKRQR